MNLKNLACPLSTEEPWISSGTTSVSCVASSKSLSLSELQLPNQANGERNSNLPLAVVVWGHSHKHLKS